MVAADTRACQCGYTFGSVADATTAAGRLRETVDLFSAKEALAIAYQAVHELKGGVVRWMAIIGVFQLLPMIVISPKPETPRDLATFMAVALLSAWTNYGLNRAAMRRMRGETTTFWESRVNAREFGAILLTILVMVIPVTIGIILFVAPGVYLLLTWSQVTFLILDGRARHVDSLRASEELTRDRRIEIFLVMMVPLLLTLPARILEAAVPTGGSMMSPGFILFLVSTLWQMLVLTFGAFASAVVYQMLLNSKKNRQP
ncbi:MAG: hypothetical protein EPO35_11465 [Acidobacteria bacterium]|nr:MAG: hypothetical protein EPO35_11465 [Acidobacteriota bacterium]